jgi:hypothetical protein
MEKATVLETHEINRTDFVRLLSTRSGNFKETRISWFRKDASHIIQYQPHAAFAWHLLYSCFVLLLKDIFAQQMKPDFAYVCWHFYPYETTPCPKPEESNP